MTPRSPKGSPDLRKALADLIWSEVKRQDKKQGNFYSVDWGDEPHWIEGFYDLDVMARRILMFLERKQK